MMKGSTKIFSIFGIAVKLHFSWWLVFILLAWMLSVSFFPAFCSEQFTVGSSNCGNLATATYWLMGITAALLLFVSVLLHELSHSLVAKARKIKVESITLFFFGGVAGITNEDLKPSSEFLMALAGPFFSLFLAGVFFLIYFFNGNGIFTAIAFYLYQINLILAVFNLLPGFPLDGGRAFRAILYWRYKDLRKATYVAAKGGKFLAVLLVLLGLFGLLSGIGGGLWFIFLGGFLYFLAGASYEQVLIREVLQQVSLKNILKKNLPSFQPQTRWAQVVKKYANTEETVFLVKDQKFAGLLDLKNLNPVPDQLQKMLQVKALAVPFQQSKSLKSNDNAYTAFKKMAEERTSVLPVFDQDQFKGVVTQDALMRCLVWGQVHNKKINKKAR